MCCIAPPPAKIPHVTKYSTVYPEETMRARNIVFMTEAEKYTA